MTLRDALWKKRIYQREVAAKANCSNKLISAHVRGRRPISEEFAKRIAAAIGAKLQRRNGAWDFVFKSKTSKSA